MKLQGATPSAVLVVKVDYPAISHTIGIVGIVDKIAYGSGAQIATKRGSLSNGPRRGQWWIPADQYVIKFGAKELANINPKLKIICQAIISGEYNDENAAKCTIQEAHQAITILEVPVGSQNVDVLEENVR
jgi:hypothetical protein